MNLLKLCVGVESFDDLQVQIETRLARAQQARETAEIIHRTRQTPRQQAALLDGGSLYWVIKGVIQARQQLLDIRPEVDGEGRPLCALVLSPELLPVQPRPHRPFQGWRYLRPEDTPPDLNHTSDADAMPAEMRAALAELALI